MGKRKGMRGARIDLIVDVSAFNDLNKRGIYVAKYRFEHGDDFTTAQSLYCAIQHDLSINTVVRSKNLGSKRIKKVVIEPVKQVGESIATELKIKDWKNKTI